MEPKKKTIPINIKNRKASFEYEFLEKFVCGAVLYGSEVKSIVQNGASISESYCYIKENAVYIKNMHIALLKNASVQHEPMREKKLLLTKKEIKKISIELKNQGLTLIPVRMYNVKGLIKVEIALSKGKKLYDKRNSLKEKQIKMDEKRGE